jgi:hypothetical protein
MDRPTYRCLDRLPFTTAPILNETVDSYLLRLASLNETAPDVLRGAVMDSAGLITPERLAAAGGQRLRSLKYAMLELCTPEDLAGMRIAGRPRPGMNERDACRRCAAARGVVETATRWTRQEDVVCLRHHWWHTNVDLTNHPEVLAANRRHRRVLRRFRREAMNAAIASAGVVCFGWIRRLEYNGWFNELASRAAPDGRTVTGYESPLFEACLYPQVIALAVILVSQDWTLLTAPENPNSIDSMVRDIRAAVAPGYEFGGAHDPLVKWYIGERGFRRQARFNRFTGIASFLPRPDVFESATRSNGRTAAQLDQPEPRR